MMGTTYDEMAKNRKKSYTLQYEREEEVGPNYDGEDRYLIYAHLDTIEASVGEITAGKLVGTVGKTGNASNASKRNTHLHFEITCRESSSSDDYKKLRYGENPAFYVNLKTPKEDEQKNNTD